MVIANIWMQALFVAGVIMVGTGILMICFGFCDLVCHSFSSEEQDA